jgi:hypothetical protein
VGAGGFLLLLTRQGETTSGPTTPVRTPKRSLPPTPNRQRTPAFEGVGGGRWQSIKNTDKPAKHSGADRSRRPKPPRAAAGRCHADESGRKRRGKRSDRRGVPLPTPRGRFAAGDAACARRDPTHAGGRVRRVALLVHAALCSCGVVGPAPPQAHAAYAPSSPSGRLGVVCTRRRGGALSFRGGAELGATNA